MDTITATAVTFTYTATVSRVTQPPTETEMAPPADANDMMRGERALTQKRE